MLFVKRYDDPPDGESKLGGTTYWSVESIEVWTCHLMYKSTRAEYRLNLFTLFLLIATSRRAHFSRCIACIYHNR